MQALLSSSPNWYLSHVLSVTKDGSVAAYAGHLSVTVVCCQQQRILRCLWPQHSRASCITFTADDAALVVGYEDGSARCFDWRSGECVCSRAASKAKRKQKTSELTAIVAPSWLSDAVVLADAGGRVLLWPFSGSRTNNKYTVLSESCGSRVTCLTAAPNAQQHKQQVIAGCEDGTCVLVVVSGSAGCVLAKWQAHTAAVQSLQWTDPAHCNQHQQSLLVDKLTLPPPQQMEQPLTPQQPLLGQSDDLHGSSGKLHLHGSSDTLHQQPHLLPAEGGTGCGFLLSAGADRRIKLWQVPPLGQATAAEAFNVDTHETAAAAAATALGSVTHTGLPEGAAAAVAEQVGGEGSVRKPLASLSEAEDPIKQGSSQAAVLTADSGAGVTAAPGAGSAAVGGPCVKLLLQPLSVAALDPHPPAAGPRMQQFYAAAAVLPGSASADGSCLVLCAGVNGRLGVVKMQPGNMQGQWTPCSKSPHVGGILQLLLRPSAQCSSSSKSTHTATQPGLLQSLVSTDNQAYDQGLDKSQQQQQQEGQLVNPSVLSDQQEQLVLPSQQPRFQPPSLQRTYHVLSVAMDRCFAIAQLSLQLSPSQSTTLQGSSTASSSNSGSSSGGTGFTVGQISSQEGCRHLQGLKLTGCSPIWVNQGVGGFIYTCVAQQTPFDPQQQRHRQGKVRVAVGCGDKTIRVVTLGVREVTSSQQQGQQTPQQQQQQERQQQQQQQVEGLLAAGVAAVDKSLEATATAAVDAGANDGKDSSSSSSGQDSCGDVRGCEVQVPFAKPLLIWKNIPDRVQAVAWHPFSTRLLAFGCHNGMVGVCDVSNGEVVLYSKRHGGPVTHVAWQQQQQQQQQEKWPGGQMSNTQTDRSQLEMPYVSCLLSLGGEGCLLAWPPISPGRSSSSSSSSTAQPTDIGPFLHTLLSQWHSSVAAGERQSVHWAGMATSCCGCFLAVYGRRGQVLMLQTPGVVQQSAEVQQGPANSASKHRSSNMSVMEQQRGAAAGPAPTAVPQLLVLACGQTPAATLIRAAAWQPDRGVHVAGGGGAAAAAAGGSGRGAAAAAAGGSGRGVAAAAAAPASRHGDGLAQYVGSGAAGAVCGSSVSSCPLLAAIDDSRLYVFRHDSGVCDNSSVPGDSDLGYSSSSDGSSSGSNGKYLVASCDVREEKQQQQQMLAVEWSSPTNICVGSSSGSVHVFKVSSQQDAHQGHLHLQPLHSLKIHTGPVLCLSGLPGWPDLLLSGSQDQTLYSCSLGLIPTATTTATTAATTAITTAAGQGGVNDHKEDVPQVQIQAGLGQGVLSCKQQQDGPDQGTAGLESQDDQALPTAVEALEQGGQQYEATVQGASAAQEVQQGPVAVEHSHEAEAQLESSSASQLQQQPRAAATGCPVRSPASSAPTSASAPVPRVKAAGAAVQKKSKPMRLFICPKAASFLPMLPNTQEPTVQQEVLLDVVALAEALYLPVNPPSKAPAAADTSASHAATVSVTELSVKAMEALGITADVVQEQQQQQWQGHNCAGVAEGWQQQLPEMKGYKIGTWLPSMTADVTALLQQCQHFVELKQQQQQQSAHNAAAVLPASRDFTAVNCNVNSSSDLAGRHVTALGASQVGMLQFLAGDVRGFLQSAAAADSFSADVVALSAAGGWPAFRAAARLAAAKLDAAGEKAAAAVHLLAADEAASAEEMLRG